MLCSLQDIRGAVGRRAGHAAIFMPTLSYAGGSLSSRGSRISSSSSRLRHEGHKPLDHGCLVERDMTRRWSSLLPTILLVLFLASCGSGGGSQPVNQVPVANAGGPYNGNVGQVITFDGSKSTDADGDMLTYAWNFGDSSTGTGVKPTHTYSAVGLFTVTLTVDDGRTGTNTASTTATVAALTPAVSDFNPKSGTVGTLISVTGSNLTLPNGSGPQITLVSQGGGTINAPISAFAATRRRAAPRSVAPPLGEVTLSL